MTFFDWLEKLLSQNIAISLLSLAISIAAITLSLRGEHVDRINSNTWETYRAYNDPDVRKGRALTLQMLRDPTFQGFATYDSYKNYFSLPPYGDGTSTHSLGRQSLHDLAAFYHQTGVLLQQRRLDKDFTLLLVGPGLADRWLIFKDMARLYGEGDTPSTFPYGGIYLLFFAYEQWKNARFSRLRNKFMHMQKQINKLSGISKGAINAEDNVPSVEKQQFNQHP